MDIVKQLDVGVVKPGAELHVSVIQLTTGMEVYVYFVLMAKYGTLQLYHAFVRQDTVGMAISVKKATFVMVIEYSMLIIKYVFVQLGRYGMVQHV
jgi:hypothetical protein